MKLIIRGIVTPVLMALLLASSLLALGPPSLAAETDPAADAVQARVPTAADFPTPSPALVRRAAVLFDRLRTSVSAQERADVVQDIAALGSEAIPIYLTELERHSKITWPVMIYALGATGDSRVIPVLQQQLRHQRERSYLDVLYALSLAGDPSALLRAMRSTHADTAFERNMTAIDFIAGAQGPAAVPILIREIPRRAEKARYAALRALGTICDARAVDFLLKWSRQPDPGDRRFALIALARIGDPRAIDRFIEALGDPDPMVREAVAEGLGYLRAEASVPRLVELLGSKEPVAKKTPRPVKTESKPATKKGSSFLMAAKVRMKSIWSLGLIGGPVARDALVTFWPQANSVEKPLLVKALGRLADPSTVDLLAEAGCGEDGLSVDAAVSLSKIPGDRSTEALLRTCSQAKNLDAGLQAGYELARRVDPRALPCIIDRLREDIDQRHRLSPVAEKTLDTLARTAQSSAADSLDTLAESVSAPALAHRLRAAAHGVRLVEELGSDLDPWLDLLENGTPEEVELAVQRLGDLGDPRAVEPLRRKFGRIESSQAQLIPEALGRIASDRATPFLISLLTEELYRVPSLRPARNAAARALTRCTRAQHVVKALRAAYLEENGDFFVALLAMARVGGPVVIPDLLELKPLLLRGRNPTQVMRHERANWTIRMLRAGRPIPLEEIKDVQ